VHVFVRGLPVVNIPDVDTSCFGAPVVLNPGGDPNFSYSWSPPEFLNDPNIPNPIAQVNQTTLFTVTITDLTTEQCQTTATVQVVVPPEIDLGAPSDTAYCDAPAITLTATGSGLQYTWYTSGGIAIGTGATITLQPQTETTYIIEGVDSYGCEVQTTVTLTPTFFDYTPSGGDVLCTGETTVLSIMNGDPDQFLTYLWSPIGGIVGPVDQSSVVVMPEVSTTFSVVITNAELGCTATETFDVQVSVFDPGDLVITVSEDTITLGESYVLSTNQDPSLYYFWDGPGIENPNLPVVIGTPTASGVYSYAVTVTNFEGCDLSGVITSLVVLNPLCSDEDIFIPDAFSPNNDGHNDVLLVYGNFISAMELRIYNRWGEEVFVSTDQSIGWDGTFEGKEVHPDVFGYYLRVECPPDKRYFTKGNITLFK
jgi:gliding motility-associated-like protein